MSLTKPKEESKNDFQRLTLNDQSLTHLYLSEDDLDKEEMQSLSEALKVNQTLIYLNLRENRRIGDEGMQALNEALKVNQTLTNLDLGNNRIGNKGMQALSESLKVNQTLNQLGLAGNKIKDEGMQALSESLKSQLNAYPFESWPELF
ncbi:leucine-rich repeat-containing protein [Anaeramoeba flamelloides]|uniref:Leucine-rich repeat-containing protein n=1 Tax=Anaeramoeba flamelloides TaxID=1746091 RepID=A0AAV7YIM2_9EUKA|nr:leucine-rich repeat-containing protein [Anaeramoeba flamelloides]